MLLELILLLLFVLAFAAGSRNSLFEVRSKYPHPRNYAPTESRLHTFITRLRIDESTHVIPLRST